jgi:hypothetical protein
MERINTGIFGTILRKMNFTNKTLTHNNNKETKKELQVIEVQSSASVIDNQNEDVIVRLQNTIQRMQQFPCAALCDEFTRLKQQLSLARSMHLEPTFDTEVCAIMNQCQVSKDRCITEDCWKSLESSMLPKVRKLVADIQTKLGMKQIESTKKSYTHQRTHTTSSETHLLQDISTTITTNELVEFVEESKASTQPKLLPKRIRCRPHPIRIPMVRVHDARMQEIELLKPMSPRVSRSQRQMDPRRQGRPMI